MMPFARNALKRARLPSRSQTDGYASTYKYVMVVGMPDGIAVMGGDWEEQSYVCEAE